MAPIIFIFICTSNNETSDSNSTSKKDSRSNSRKRGVRATETGLTKIREAKAAGLGDDKRLTNEVLANKANVSTKTVQRFLTGKKIDEGLAIAILKVLKLEPKEILEKD